MPKTIVAPEGAGKPMGPFSPGAHADGVLYLLDRVRAVFPAGQGGDEFQDRPAAATVRSRSRAHA